jgi:hypothetical protein
MLPANETDPISAERTIAVETLRSRVPGSAIDVWKSEKATRAAAPPPTPLNSATICGIAVIFTARAAYQPIGAVTAITIRIQTNWSESRPGMKNVATMAIAMPNAPIRLPWRARAGLERKRSARMKQTIVTRYASVTQSYRLTASVPPPPLSWRARAA